MENIGKIHVWIDIKMLSGEYKETLKHFKTEEALNNYVKDQMVRGNKVVGIHPVTMKLSEWNWKVFFEIHPEYISDQGWKNAQQILKEEDPKEYFRFQLYVHLKNFKSAKEEWLKLQEL